MDRICIQINRMEPCLRHVNLLLCSPGMDTGARKLYHYYFLYVHSGKGQVEINGKWYDTAPGDLFYCAPGITNTIVANREQPFLLSGIDFDFTQNHTEAQPYYAIGAGTFTPDRVHETVEFVDFAGFPDRMTIPDDTAARELILAMVRQVTEKKRHFQLYADGLLKAFIAGLVQRVTSRDLGGGRRNRGDQVVRYLSEHYMENLTNEHVGTLFHYHSDHINRIVFSHTGMSLRQYLIDLRIRLAIDLLQNTDMPVSAVAMQVGYENTPYFTRIFRMKTGQSPGKLRKKQRSG